MSPNETYVRFVRCQMLDLKESEKIPVARVTVTTGTTGSTPQHSATAATTIRPKLTTCSGERNLLERLAASVPGGYFARGEAASEPTALGGPGAAGKRQCRRRPSGSRLARRSHQAENGARRRLVDSKHALLADESCHSPLADDGRPGQIWQRRLRRAVDWALREQGTTQEHRPTIGHDTTLVGWSWAANTHSWLEPTAMFVMALKAVGLS